MKIEKYFYGVCALCLLLSCQQAAKQVDTPVLPTLRGENETCQYVVDLKMTDCFGCQSVMVE